jgi:hypothetical protein
MQRLHPIGVGRVEFDRIEAKNFFGPLDRTGRTAGWAQRQRPLRCFRPQVPNAVACRAGPFCVLRWGRSAMRNSGRFDSSPRVVCFDNEDAERTSTSPAATDRGRRVSTSERRCDDDLRAQTRRLVTTETAYAYDDVATHGSGPCAVERQRSPPSNSRLRTLAWPRTRRRRWTWHRRPPNSLELLARSADHRLVVSDPSSETRAAWRRLLYAARREHTAGGDIVLRHTGRARGDLVIWLEPRVEADVTPTSVASVEVPDRVRRPHPLIAELRHITVGYRGWIDTHRLPDVAHVRISPASKQRTIRILHALALEAQRRGHTVESSSSDRCPGGFGISIDGHCTNSPSSSTTDASSRADRQRTGGIEGPRRFRLGTTLGS